jgi:PEP-CTERM motif
MRKQPASRVPYSFFFLTYPLEDFTPVPEPASVRLLGTGLAALARAICKRRTEASPDRCPEFVLLGTQDV